MDYQDEEGQAALRELAQGMGPLLVGLCQDAWESSNGHLALIDSVCGGKNATAKAFFLILFDQLADVWLADEILSILRAPDADVPKVLWASERLTDTLSPRFGRRLMLDLFLLYLVSTLTRGEGKLGGLILHAATAARMNQILFSQFHARKTERQLLEWLTYKGPTTRQDQARMHRQLGRGLTATPAGQPAQYPLPGEAWEDFYGRRIEVLVKVYNDLQDFSRADYRLFFSFSRPHTPEDQALRPGWIAGAPAYFTRRIRHTMGHLLPVIGGVVGKARFKARDQHSALLDREGGGNVDRIEQADESYHDPGAARREIDTRLAVQQILAIAQKHLGQKAVQAMNMIRLGKTRTEIAAELGITEKTIYNWLAKIRDLLS